MAAIRRSRRPPFPDGLLKKCQESVGKSLHESLAVSEKFAVHYWTRVQVRRAQDSHGALVSLFGVCEHPGNNKVTIKVVNEALWDSLAIETDDELKGWSIICRITAAL